MYQHLRALIYDPSHSSGAALYKYIFETFDNGQALSVILATQPKSIIEKSIIAIDPSEVIDIQTNDSTRRSLAIIDTPDLASVVLTSGTTAKPKPIELTYFGLHSSVESIYKMCNLSKEDIWLCCLPAQYIGGLAIFARSWVMGSQVHFSPLFDPEIISKTIRENGVTITSLVPAQLKMLLDSKTDLSSLRTVLLGGGKIDSELVEQAKNLGLEIYTSYGLTETWGGINFNGNFIENTKGRIQNSMLEIKSDSIMAGYRHDFIQTSQSFTPDLWFQTKDLASLENDSLEIYGRSDDLINTGGLKVDPVPIENLLGKILVDNSFAICATRHKKFGQAVTLCIETIETNADLEIDLNAIRNQLLEFIPKNQLPVRLATIESIPKTTSGKIKRKDLEDRCKIIMDITEHE